MMQWGSKAKAENRPSDFISICFREQLMQMMFILAVMMTEGISLGQIEASSSSLAKVEWQRNTNGNNNLSCLTMWLYWYIVFKDHFTSEGFLSAADTAKN